MKRDKVNRIRTKLDDIIDMIEDISNCELQSSNLMSKVLHITSTKPEYKEVFELVMLISSNKDTDMKVLSDKIHKILNKLVLANNDLIDLMNDVVLSCQDNCNKQQPDLSTIGMQPKQKPDKSLLEFLVDIIPKKGVAQILFYGIILCLLMIVLSLLGQSPVEIVNSIKGIK